MSIIVGSYSNSRIQSHRVRNTGATRFVSSFTLCHDAVYCCCCVPVSHRKRLLLWQPRCNCSSPNPRCPCCDSYEGASVCVRVCVLRGRVILNNEGQLHPTLPLNFKRIRAVQRQYKAAAAAQRQSTHHRENRCQERACSAFSSCDTLEISSENHINRIPKGNLKINKFA